MKLNLSLALIQNYSGFERDAVRRLSFGLENPPGFINDADLVFDNYDIQDLWWMFKNMDKYGFAAVTKLKLFTS